jgi:hypothetical protein
MFTSLLPMNPALPPVAPRRRFVSLFLLSAAILSAADAPPPAWQPRVPDTTATNLVPNSGFEAGEAGWSSLGRKTGYGGGLGSLFGKVTTAQKFEGAHSLEVALGPGKTVTTYYDVLPAATVRQLDPLAMNIGWITVIPGQSYTLSAYLKADRAGVPARLAVRFGGKILPSPEVKMIEQAVTLTTEWKRYAFTFQATEASAFVGAGPVLADQPDAAATVWIDAVQLEKSEAPSAYAPRAAVEVALESGRYGNVFPDGTPPVLTFTAVNRTEKTVDLDVVVELTDYFDAALPPLQRRVSVPARGRVAEPVALSLPGPGYYKLTAKTTGAGVADTRRFPLAVIHEYKQADGPFGMNHPPATAEMMDRLRQAGVVWARNWALDWNEVEPRPGEFAWAEADRQVKRVQESGWQVLSLLPAFSATRWSSELPADFKVPPTWRGAHDWAWLASAPKDPAQMADYIRAVVGRYKGSLKYWEFLNEPGTSTALPSPYRGMPGYRYDAQTYLDLLKVGSKAVRETDPAAKLIGGFALEVLFRAPQFIRGGGLELIDILSIHPYAFFEESPEQFIPQLDKLLALMDASPSGRKPIWVTESGYYAEDDKPWEPWIAPPGHFSAAVTMKSEKMAADHTIRQAVVLFAHGVEKIIYHQGADGELNSGLHNLENCLLGPRGTPQKVYPATAYLAHLFGTDFKYVAAMEKPAEINGLSTGAVHGYAFQCGNKAVLVAWAPEEWQQGKVWTLKIPRDVDAFNIVGTKISDGGNGKKVRLGDTPVYLVTDLMSAADLAAGQLLRVAPGEGTEPSRPITTF